MKNKKWLLVLIIAFPSLFWLILETSTINSRKLPYYGPKVPLEKGDTVFYEVSAPYLAEARQKPFFNSERQLYTICFLAEAYRDDAYRLTGLWEYLNYKRSKIAPLPVILIAEKNAGHQVKAELSKLEEHENVVMIEMPTATFKPLRDSYFKEKPYYIDYSFFLLIDADKHVRGYYDARYVSEIKRLLEEYQHLRLKEEKQLMIKNNEIRSDN